MKLVVLGSGTSIPHRRRSSPSFWLQTDCGTLLIDMGADAPHRMAEESLDWPAVDAIWLSHFHLDHIGGLAPFLFGARWAPQMQARRKPLRIYGPKGLAPLIKAINDSNNYKLLDQSFPVEIIEITAGEEFEILNGLVATTVSTPHTPESLALRLTERNGKTFVYTSDTGFSNEIVNFAQDANLLLLECSFRCNKPLQTHLELNDAMTIATQSRPQIAVLTHLYPEWDHSSPSAEAEAMWNGKTVEAVDGLRLDF